MLDIINALLDYWVHTHWTIALLMSSVVNIIVFVITAAILDTSITKLIKQRGIGQYIDTRPFKPQQKMIEIKNGIIACIIFAVSSLLSRILYTELWPSSLWSLGLQITLFVLFYESYSYFIHRLLHTRALLKIHGVHHWSARNSPWTAYSVHPVEALLIAISAPIFMLLLPLSLGVALVFHISGMILTIFLHANYTFGNNNPALKKLTQYPLSHATHHGIGRVNFGFINSFWDKLLQTKAKA